MVLSIERSTTQRTPSRYQQAVLDALTTGQGNILVEATAGSGKTTLLEMCAKEIKGEGLFLAFNKHIAEELGPRVAPMTCKTLHSLGNSAVYKALGKTSIDNFKTSKIARRFGGNLNQFGRLKDASERDKYQWFAKLLDFSRLTLWDGSANGIADMIDAYALQIPNGALRRLDVVATILQQALQSGLDDAAESKVIDFTDMIWLPIVMDLRIYTFDWVFVDEAQDLNACQLALLQKAGHEDTRFLFVGDRDQSMYGFAGANTNSLDIITETMGATRYPLSICYRCPRKIVELAQQFSETIEPSPTAKEGTVIDTSVDKVPGLVQQGDFILSRKTAPLVELCLTLIARGKKATVKGRNISAQLTSIVEAVSEMAEFEWAEFPNFLSRYHRHKVSKLTSEEDEEKRLMVDDQCAAVKVCYESFAAESVDELIDQIDAIFTTEGSAITLCTVHRAKGLEGDRVFILNPDEMPLTWKGQTADQLQQERNVAFVAFTRAKDTLFLVEEEEREQKGRNRVLMGQVSGV
jgi:DNA helicase II / ATP-dependent DNA helicase PcrA